MYVCVCHALTDREVRAAVTEGAGSPSAVFRKHQTKPVCGKCVQCMHDVINESRVDETSEHNCPNRDRCSAA